MITIETDLNIWSLAGIGLLIFLIIIFLFWFMRWVKRAGRAKQMVGLDREEIQKKWAEIEALTERNEEMSYKLAVVEADKLLDYVLKSMFFPGDDMGQRLKTACVKYPDLREVWWPHKVRNQLVHEASYHLDQRQAKAAVKSFKKALQKLGALS